MMVASKEFFAIFPILIMGLFAPSVFAAEDTRINVAIVGEPVIDINSNYSLLRADIDIENFDATEGTYYMQIVQSATGNLISNQEIVVREFSNDEAGSSVAYMINKDDFANLNGTITGFYEVVINTELGNSIGRTNFSIIENSGILNTIQEGAPLGTSSTEVIPIPLQETVGFVEINSEEGNKEKIPEWVKNIFVMYAEEKISENELLNALKFLIQEEIITV